MNATHKTFALTLAAVASALAVCAFTASSFQANNSAEVVQLPKVVVSGKAVQNVEVVQLPKVVVTGHHVEDLTVAQAD